MWAEMRDASGQVQEAGVEIEWYSADPEIAEVEEDGTIVALAAGEVMIRANCSSHCAWATIHVTKVRGTKN